MNERDIQSLKNRYDIIGSDQALDRALETAVVVAPSDLTVLIIGESGVGKEVFPKIIHQNSRRRTGKYFAINCGAIPEGTVDSELFGHEKGAFTGAIEARKGYFEEADGGTLFLDEIAELPLATQARLLRVLQSGEFIRVGSSKIQKTDVRVIAATNVNLAYAVSKGKFRADLYYRLNTITIRIPALRERPDDIPLLFRKFATDFSEKNQTRNIALTQDAVTLLKSYRWPGNVRELKSVADRVCALESSGAGASDNRVTVTAVALSRHMPGEEASGVPALAPAQPAGGMNGEEREMIIRSILSLKQDVEQLKATVETLRGGAAPESPVKMIENAPESVHEPDMIDEQIADEQFQEELDAARLDLRQNEEQLILKALEKHSGNRKKAALELGMAERTLYRKLKRMNL
ncbi:MAG: sigma-54 dependent transcriptional regulator [Bacteroidales bacterium]|nr:sigma-54 dependent transcriptional regulator [Bacteroidales bacterium]